MTTTETIYDHLASEAATEASLVGLAPNPDSAAQLAASLSSGSKVDIHRLVMRLFAYAAKLQQDLFDLFKVEVENLAKDGHYGTVRWFVSRAKRFQFGHALVFTDLDAGYAVDDPAARIVTHSAVVELANQVTVKVAKAAGTGLQPLTPEELLAINDYFQELRPPVQVMVITAPADRIKLIGSVVYDGQTGMAAVQASVNLALRNYLKRLDFGGVVRVTELKAAILSAPGVVDVRLTNVEVRTTGPWVNVPRIHYTYAGHAEIDTSSPISSTLTWEVGNV